MTCKAYNTAYDRPCEKDADPSFPCCSVSHGMEVKQAKEWFLKMREGILTLDDFYSGMGMKAWTVGKYLHYLAITP